MNKPKLHDKIRKQVNAAVHRIVMSFESQLYSRDNNKKSIVTGITEKLSLRLPEGVKFDVIVEKYGLKAVVKIQFISKIKKSLCIASIYSRYGKKTYNSKLFINWY